jgi:hypothetical protein
MSTVVCWPSPLLGFFCDTAMQHPALAWRACLVDFVLTPVLHLCCAGKCILVWACQKDPCWCPQCKAPFTSLITYRKLDGTLAEFPVEESVCLLKRAHWFEAYLKVNNRAVGLILAWLSGCLLGVGIAHVRYVVAAQSR